jgi:hypothetical protein
MRDNTPLEETQDSMRCDVVLELQYSDGTGIKRYRCIREEGHGETDGKAPIHWDEYSPMWRTMIPGRDA